MTRSTATGRFGAPASGPRRRPAHLAPSSRSFRQVGSSGLAALSGPVSALSRLGLAAVLGTGLVAAGQVSSTGSPQTAATAAATPAGTASGSAGSAGTAGVVDLTGTTAPVASTTMTASARRAKAIRVARQYVGVRYRYGGTTPRGFDCSGYTRYVWKKAGKALPRTSRAQYAKARKISRARAVPGDLVFFKSSSGRVYHVGIYAGKNKMYDAPRPGKRVALRTIWSKRVSFGRV